MISFRRGLMVAILLIMMVSASGCAGLPAVELQIGEQPVRVSVKSVPLKIVMAAGDAALRVAAEEYLGVRLDSQELLGQIVQFDQAEKTLPPDGVPVIMVIDKTTNDMYYWQLTDNVAQVRLRHEDPGAIELQVRNESPLRVELWIEGPIDELEIDVDIK